MSRPNAAADATPPGLSVLCCTHNPRDEVLRRTLGQLAAQTLDRAEWELLLIDNASASPVRARHDLSWHPRGRHLAEARTGKTHAIALGASEAKGDVLVIVDDDNLLQPDYLENAARIFREHTFLGVAGGRISGEYETPPPDWSRHYLSSLAIVDQGDGILYSCTPDKSHVPPGAGMVIRKRIVLHYLRAIAQDPVRQGLDPVGDQLSRAGDTDMALCAYEVGLAKGYFPQLRLTHLIPAGRLQLAYLERLAEESEYCDLLLQFIRGLKVPAAEHSWPRRWLEELRWWKQHRRLGWAQIRLERARRRGFERAGRHFLRERAGQTKIGVQSS